MKYKKVIFVCTANTCRSPVGEGSLKKGIELHLRGLEGKELNPQEFLEKNYLENLEVKSMGLATFPGMPATFESENYAKRFFDIDLSQHRSSRLSPYDLEEGTLFLCMTEAHADYLKQKEGGYEVYTLLEFIGEVEKNISDPYGFSEKVYEQMVHQIYAACEKVLEKLLKSAQ